MRALSRSDRAGVEEQGHSRHQVTTSRPQNTSLSRFFRAEPEFRSHVRRTSRLASWVPPSRTVRLHALGRHPLFSAALAAHRGSASVTRFRNRVRAQARRLISNRCGSGWGETLRPAPTAGRMVSDRVGATQAERFRPRQEWTPPVGNVRNAVRSARRLAPTAPRTSALRLRSRRSGKAHRTSTTSATAGLDAIDPTSRMRSACERRGRRPRLSARLPIPCATIASAPAPPAIAPQLRSREDDSQSDFMPAPLQPGNGEPPSPTRRSAACTIAEPGI